MRCKHEVSMNKLRSVRVEELNGKKKGGDRRRVRETWSLATVATRYSLSLSLSLVVVLSFCFFK